MSGSRLGGQDLRRGQGWGSRSGSRSGQGRGKGQGWGQDRGRVMVMGSREGVWSGV